MDESVSQMMQEQLQRAENDLTLACLQEIEGVPTRKEIIERLPPLGKAALAYDPTRDDFFDLLDKYAVPMTDEEYIEFANGLFFDTFGIRYIAYEEKNRYEVFAKSASRWYELFGFQSRAVLQLLKINLERKAAAKKQLNILKKKAQMSIGRYGHYIRDWYYDSYLKFQPTFSFDPPSQALILKMADDFFENLPYNTGRLINKLIVEATGEKVGLPYEVRKIDNGSIDISNATFPIFVYKNVCHCIKCEQKYGVKNICDRQALVQTSKKQWVPIGIQYCQGCNKGFINQEILDSYNKRYGQILFERSYSDEEKVLLSAKELAKDSVLSRCGYSVEKGIDKEYRQNVLAYVLDSKKATKDEVQELLSFFIRFHKQANFASARQCWREDLSFVVNYKIDNQALIGKAVFKKP